MTPPPAPLDPELPPPDSRFTPGRASLLLIVLVGGVYATAFGGAWLLDDFDSILNSPNVRSLTPLRSSMGAPPGSTVTARPLVAFTLALSYALSGYETWGYHLLNILAHLSVTLLLFGVVRRTLLSPRCRERFGASATGVAFAAALLWALHPLGTICVTYVIQRAESIGALFTLLALYALIRRLEGGLGWFWSLVAVLACAAGMGSKENVFALPLLALLYDGMLGPDGWREALRKRWGFYALLASTWALLAAAMLSGARLEMLGSRAEVTGRWTYLLTQAEVLVHYLKLVVAPWGQRFIYDWPLAASLGQVAAQGLFVVALLLGTAWGCARGRAWGFAGAVFFLVLAPTSSLVPLSLVAGEQRMYLPSAAALVLLVAAGSALLRRLLPERAVPAAGVALLAVFACALAALTVRRNLLFHDEVRVWEEVLEAEPENGRALHGLGMLYLRRKEPAEALPYLERGIDFADQPVRTHNALGAAYLLLKREDEARREFETALELDPDFTDALNNLATIQVNREEYARAEATYQRSLKRMPGQAAPLMGLGFIRMRQGKLEEAIAYLKRAVAADPASADAQRHLKTAQQALTRRTFAQVEQYVQRGKALVQQGQLDAGLQNLYYALRLMPKQPEALGQVEQLRVRGEAMQRKTGRQRMQGLDLLASVHAVRGEFAEARRLMAQARDAAKGLGDAARVKIQEERLELFGKGQAYPPPPKRN
ncbi:MAG: tetratricopeptide repeat protein [Planctomycetota bacterium]|nr:tetratricopeptide repeat protein [Planctomycetota bacterium]